MIIEENKKNNSEKKWQPTPRQVEALTRTEFEVLFGGARSGGKSEAGLAWLLYDTDHKDYKALVLRRNATDMHDWVERARKFYTPLGAVFSGNTITFPSGAKITMGHLADEDAYQKYQGHEYHRILFEELTHIPTEKEYLMVLASCRSTVKELVPQIFATCNPDGPGFYWVRTRWNISGVPNVPIVSGDEKNPRVFVPSKIDDNPYLSNSTNYRSFLDGLPDGLRQAWRDGSWADPIIQGAIYQKEMAQAKTEKRIGVFNVDTKLPVHTAWDLGSAQNMAVILFQKRSNNFYVVGEIAQVEEGVAGYWKLVQQWAIENNSRLGFHFFPHDSNTRERGTGKTVLDVAGEIGMRNYHKIPVSSVKTGIERVVLTFPRVFFNATKTEHLLSSLENYRYTYDQKLLVWRKEPVGDWASHMADAFRYMCLSDTLSPILQDEVKEVISKNKKSRRGLTNYR